MYVCTVVLCVCGTGSMAQQTRIYVRQEAVLTDGIINEALAGGGRHEAFLQLPWLRLRID